jgi:hypothetical protein
MRNMIIGFIFQLILGFNCAIQSIMHGDTSFSVFTSADRPTASIIMTLPLESMVVLTRAVAFRPVVSRREPQSFILAENEEGASLVVFVMSIPLFLEVPFSVLSTPILVYQHIGCDGSAGPLGLWPCSYQLRSFNSSADTCISGSTVPDCLAISEVSILAFPLLPGSPSSTVLVAK